MENGVVRASGQEALFYPGFQTGTETRRMKTLPAHRFDRKVFSPKVVIVNFQV